MGIISNLGFGIPVITGQFMTVSLQAFWTHVSLKHPLALHLCRQAAAQLDDCSYRGLQARTCLQMHMLVQSCWLHSAGILTS